jgi:hypothetical protein
MTFVGRSFVCRNFGRKIDGWLARKLRMTTNRIYAAEAHIATSVGPT